MNAINMDHTGIIAKMGIPSDKYQKDWKSRLRRERYKFFTNFRSGTPARRQVTLENCVYSERERLDSRSVL